MAKAATHYKCTECKGMFPAIEIETINHKKYCKICGVARRKEIEINKKLNDFLWYLSDEDKDFLPYLTTQVKQLKESNGWKAESILAVLEYVFNKEEPVIPFERKYGIKTAVEKYFSTVRDYYIGRKELQEKFPDEEILNILTKPPRIIRVKRSQILKEQEEFREKQKDAIYGPARSLDEVPDEEYDDFDEDDY